MDKPAGPTSHDVVAKVRRAVGTRRVGHAGTLDPFATGLLVVLVGRATRLARFVSDLPKTYTGVLRLGQRTDTDDLTGEPLGPLESSGHLDDATIREAMQGLTGRYPQQPPVYSAKKLQGRPAHRRARRGEAVELSPSWVEVEEFTMAGRDQADVRFVARVGSGAYIRALARDLGDRLGCGAHLRELRRTAIGPLRVDQAHTIEDVREGKARIEPALLAVQHLAVLPVDPAGRDAVIHGRSLEATGMADGQFVALVSGSDLLGVGEARTDGVHPRVVLAT